MAHLRSGSFPANGAWLALAALARNLIRALATLAGHGLHQATTATIRQTLIAIPARLVRSARRRHLRMPQNWPWQRALRWCRRRIDVTPLPAARGDHRPRFLREMVDEGREYGPVDTTDHA